jgi:hypothetical protein
MARKPRSQWSPAYRRRVEAAEAKGKTGPARRGHKPREHVERREKERTKLGGLDAYQRGKVDQFALKQARRMGKDADLVRVKLRAWAGRVGFDRFNAYKAEVKRLAKLPRIRVRVCRRVGERIHRVEIGGGSNNTGAMLDAFDDFDLPRFDDDEDNFMWFFYH